MKKHDPEPFIRDAPDKVTDPTQCGVCSEEITASDGDVVYLTSDGSPRCETHKEAAEQVGSLKSCGGYPWNGMNPETGETQYFKSTSWFRIADTLPK